jgi:hypothetical protein
MDSDHTFTHTFWSYINTWILIMHKHMNSDHTSAHEFSSYINTWMYWCMIIIYVLMYDQNSCLYVWSEFMSLCMIRIHVLMYDQSLRVDVWSEFTCWCMINQYMNSDHTSTHELSSYIKTWILIIHKDMNSHHT